MYKRSIEILVMQVSKTIALTVTIVAILCPNIGQSQDFRTLSDLVSLGRHYLFLIETPGYYQEGSIQPSHLDDIDKSLERLEQYHVNILFLVDNLPSLLENAIDQQQYRDDIADFRALRSRFNEINLSRTSERGNVDRTALVDLFSDINRTTFMLGSHGAYAAPAFLDAAALQHLVAIRLQLDFPDFDPNTASIMFSLHRKTLIEWLDPDAEGSFEELIDKYGQKRDVISAKVESFEDSFISYGEEHGCVQIAQYMYFVDDFTNRGTTKDFVACLPNLSGDISFSGFIETDQKSWRRGEPALFANVDHSGGDQSGHYFSGRALNANFINQSECVTSLPARHSRVNNLGEATVQAESLAECVFSEVAETILDRQQADEKVRAVKKIARNAREILDEIE